MWQNIFIIRIVESLSLADSEDRNRENIKLKNIFKLQKML